MVIFPKPGRAEFLRTLLDNEVHFELSTSPVALAADDLTLGTPVLRKPVFTKGYAHAFMNIPHASIGYTADAGEVSADQTLVYNRLSAMKSLIYAGDMSYAGMTAPQITAALAVFQPFIAEEALFPAWGNHDQDSPADLALLKTYFPYLSGADYYTRSIPYDVPQPSVPNPVHLTCYHSGHTTGPSVITEAGIGSEQALELKALANASTSPWKVLVVHHPPVTGSDRYQEDLAHLCDGTWDLILCGHSHTLEEIDCNGTRVLNVSAVKENRGSSDLVPES